MAAHVLDLPLDDVIKQKAGGGGGGGGGGGRPAAVRAPVVAAKSLGTGNAKATRCVNPKGLSLALKAAAAAAKATSATAAGGTKPREAKVEGAAKAGGRARAAAGKAGGPAATAAGKLVNPGEKLAMTLDDVIKRQSKADAAGNRRQRGGIRRQGGRLRTTSMTQGRSMEGKVRGRARAKAKAKARMGPMMSRMRAKRGRPEPTFAWGNSNNRFAGAAGPARGGRASSGRASGFDFGRMANRGAPARPLWGWAAVAAPPPKRARTWQEGPSDWEPPVSRRGGRGTRVRVGNIPRNLDCYDIREAFEDVGRVSGCDVSSGVAYVWFDREIDAKKAVQTFDRGELNGQTITVRMV